MDLLHRKLAQILQKGIKLEWLTWDAISKFRPSLISWRKAPTCSGACLEPGSWNITQLLPHPSLFWWWIPKPKVLCTWRWGTPGKQGTPPTRSQKNLAFTCNIRSTSLSFFSSFFCCCILPSVSARGLRAKERLFAVCLHLTSPHKLWVRYETTASSW